MWITRSHSTRGKGQPGGSEQRRFERRQLQQGQHIREHWQRIRRSGRGIRRPERGGERYVVSDTTVNFTLKHGQAYCFKMTVVNGNAMTPGFTVGNGDVLKTQFVAKIGNDYYYRVYAIGTPGQSTGVYTTLPGQNAVKHCAVTIG